MNRQRRGQQCGDVGVKTCSPGRVAGDVFAARGVHPPARVGGHRRGPGALQSRCLQQRCQYQLRCDVLLLRTEVTLAGFRLPQAFSDPS
jgi:hypothetical protein